MTPPARRLVHTTAMGLRDTAKKVAEQAQAKLDEAQERVRGARDERSDPAADRGEAGAPLEAHAGEHERPVPDAPPATTTPPQGDPLTPAGEPAATTGPVPDPSAPPPAPPERPHGDPLAD
jgi:hypothetical protein